MHRHLLEVSDLSRNEIDQLFAGADEDPQTESLAGSTLLASFFQESTRTRLGFMAAAARQGAAVLDMGDAERLRREPPSDQQMVLAEVADIVAVRHWDSAFAHDLAAIDRCAVVNAGAGPKSHPTQALIDAYTIIRTLGCNVAGSSALFLGDTMLRSAESFQELAAVLGIAVSRCPVPMNAAVEEYEMAEEQIAAADVVYVQSLSSADYGTPKLNVEPYGRALPDRITESIARSGAFIMHALPRGPELPDALLRSRRCLVRNQVEFGMPVRSAVLRWVVGAL